MKKHLGMLLLPLLVLGTSDANARQKKVRHAQSGGWVWLDEMDLNKVTQEWGKPQARKSVDGNPITLNGRVHARGLGSHSTGEVVIDLKGSAVMFEATVGVDDERLEKGSVAFHVFVDGKLMAETPTMKGGDQARRLSVPLSGARRLTMVMTDGRDGNTNDHADWADARIFLKHGTMSKPEMTDAPMEPTTQIVRDESTAPRINGPRMIGATPNRPFMHMVPATGAGPFTFSARNLPHGLMIDSRTGIISGSIRAEGTTVADIQVQGSAGTANAQITFIAGSNKLTRTPPMGWNSWNVWGCAIDEQKIRDAADGLVRSGLAAHGYQYINIDDCWQAGRDSIGRILPNSKFPNMKGLVDYVHSKGLKIGTYSSPGPKTCAGYTGSKGYELQDAQQYAEWGFDYLKYDWCSETSRDLQEPYRIMRAALDQVNRDIVFSLCQYGMGRVWTWGEEVGGNLWRTTGDIWDNWFSMSGIGFNQDGLEPYAKPGHFNDPDMLVVGKVGWGPNLHPTRLKPNEQVTHITLWSMLAAPLLIGADLTALDDFTLSILTHDEVLAIDQDTLGQAGRRVFYRDVREVWLRPLADGSRAVAFFNRGPEALKVRVRWDELGLERGQHVRDVWARRDVGVMGEGYEAVVPGHGTHLIRIREAR